MKYCKNCGRELVDEAVFCPGCGMAQEKAPSQQNNSAALKGGAVGFLLTFFIGLIGFILCLCLGDEACKKAAKLTFIISIIAVVFIYLVIFMLAIATA